MKSYIVPSNPPFELCCKRKNPPEGGFAVLRGLRRGEPCARLEGRFAQARVSEELAAAAAKSFVAVDRSISPVSFTIASVPLLKLSVVVALCRLFYKVKCPRKLEPTDIVNHQCITARIDQRIGIIL